MGAFGQRLAVAVGQIIEAIEQFLHQIGVEGVVAGGRANTSSTSGPWRSSRQPARGSLYSGSDMSNSLHPEDAVLLGPGIGSWQAASARASTVRLWAGSITPSSQRRALA